jgi:hypothetical protein
MKSRLIFIFGASTVLMFAMASHAEVKTVIGHNRNEYAAPDFKFRNVPSPSKSDAAIKAQFTIVDGRRDRNGGSVDKLADGKIPNESKTSPLRISSLTRTPMAAGSWLTCAAQSISSR